MTADGGSVRNLTSNTVPDYTFAWSPDGSQLAFWSARDGPWEIYLMNADGTNVQQLTNLGAWETGSLAWRP